MPILRPETIKTTVLHVECVQALGFWRYDNLAMPHWRFYWNQTPGARIIFKESMFEMLPDRCWAIPPETHFSSDHSTPFTHFCMHFTAGPPFDQVTPQIFELPASADLMAPVTRLIRTVPDDSKGYRVSILSSRLVYTVLDHLPEDIFSSRTGALLPTEVFEYIDENCTKRVTVSELARIAGMNTDAFIRSFRHKMHITPARYMLRKRLDRACILLTHTDMSIKQIASECGFRDRNYFTTVFRRERGVTPAQMQNFGRGTDHETNE